MQRPFSHSSAVALQARFLPTADWTSPRWRGDDDDGVSPRGVAANGDGIMECISHPAAVLHPDGESELSSHTAT